MALEVGDKAPAFSLPAVGGKSVSLDDYLGRQVVVLYFYPKDLTPGCTQEACDFRDRSEELRQAGAVVLGVSPDSVKSHEKFLHEKLLNFPLLADEDHAVCEAYGVWGEKMNYGKTYWGVVRSTFVIGKDGRIAQVWRKVKVPSHVEEVLAAVTALK